MKIRFWFRKADNGPFILNSRAAFRMKNVCWVIVWNVSPIAKFLFSVDEDELFLEGQRQSNIVGPKLKQQALTVCKLNCKHITYVRIVLNASSLLWNVTLVYELPLFWCKVKFSL